MIAIWKPVERQATALARCSVGTRVATMARPAGWLKARTLPNRKATMKKGQASDGFARVKAMSRRAPTSCTA
jgi:hypothetical protein